jgi:hypothetical protein
MKAQLPQSVKACLWSYDTDKMNLFDPNDRFVIILSILNYGTDKAVEWLLANSNEEDIKETIRKSYGTEWNKKSLSFWSLIYNTVPTHQTRFTNSNGTILAHSR